MKKIICLLLAIGLSLGLFACSNNKPDGLSVYVPNGATALSLAYMMENHQTIEGADMNYNVVAPDIIKGYVQDKSADLAILPANLAVNLYKAGADYKMAAVVTHGNLFIIGPEVSSMQDFNGKVIAAIGQGAIPDLVLKYILEQNGLTVRESDTAKADVVSIRYVAEGSNVVQALSQNEATFGLIAEPVATNATKNANLIEKGVKELFDVQAEWKKAVDAANDTEDTEAGFPQAVLLVKNGTDDAIVNKFLQLMKDNDGWSAKSTDNATKAVAAILAHSEEGATMPALTPEVIERCNITTKTEGIKDYVDAFMSAVGMAKPDNFDGLFR